jgi:peptidyl-prolyl cis-trans isomerase D
MAKSRGPQQPTKKHLARLERERRQQRILIAGTIIVLIAVLFLISYGWIQSNLIVPRQPVASVEGETISAGQFSARARFERYNLVQQALSNYQTLQLIQDTQSDLALSIINNIQQIRFSLDPTSFGREILDTMVDDVLVQKEAESRGITVTEEEIDQEIQRQFGFFPDGPLPTATSFPTALPTSTLSPEQLELVTPIPTATDFPTATPDASATPTAIPSPTATLEATLTPTPYTEEAFQQNFRDTIAQFSDEIDVGEADIRALIRAQLYREKLQELLAVDIPLTQQQVWARHILVEDEETANQVKGQLAEGADWSQLAQEFSIDDSNKSNGGDLGWFGIGVMVPEFEKAAFGLDAGQTSEPIQTSFGYHIIQVLGKEDRSITSSEYNQAVQEALQAWLETQLADSDVEIFDRWTEVAPSEPTIPQELLDSLGI